MSDDEGDSSSIEQPDWHMIGGASLSLSAVSAAIASSLTKLVLFPFDTIKCRLQTGRKGADIFRGNIFSGLLPKLALYAPYQSLYMTGYTASRDFLYPLFPTHITFCVCGAIAELSSCFIRVPMEAIKQRRQAGIYSSSFDFIRKSPIIGVSRQVLMAQTFLHDIPYGMVQWSVYEYLKREGFSDSGTVCGTIAGGVSGFVTTPLDVIKTRIVTSDNKYVSITMVVREILHYENGGWRGLMKGSVARVCHMAPSTGLYFFLFNQIYNNHMWFY